MTSHIDKGKMGRQIGIGRARAFAMSPLFVYSRQDAHAMPQQHVDGWLRA